MSFPRYREYGDEIDWLGKLPSHWRATRFKDVIEHIEAGTSVNATDVPAVHGQPGVLKTSCVYTGEFDASENKAVVPEEIDRVSCPVKAGTLIVSRMNTPELVGAAGLVREPADNVFLPDRLWQVHLAGVEPSFVHYWTRTREYRCQVQVACSGTSSSMQNLAQDQLRNMLLAVPPLSEQQAIAHFLDRETGKIVDLVAEQQRLIELLQEKRQAVISHAVTKGLDPAAPMKDSGVGWLGEVPAHWDVCPLMHLTDPTRPIMYGIILPGPNVDEGIPIVKGGDVKPHRLRLDLLNRTTPEIEAPYARARLQSGDIVYSIRGTIGEAELVPGELNGANITQDAARIAPNDSVLNRWLLHAVRSRPVFVQLEQRSLGAAVRGINIFDLKRARIPVPPPAERLRIADHLDHELAAFDGLRAAAENAIALLQERRAALISAAVTGKIDVRNLATAAAEAA
ncbi:restriction endonuclease subunit S [Bradyrhizobium sp. SZCCHNRI2007]|uniref:restriction endonuclease subunit S n=1 Tax=Bradyrhizobium sp. SZCCHNRI2007 TaxID=3057281 RepID=UPI0028E920AD|nr:restriction endonuclease subunit S [Bradyrhizobium sp. SZCCHNRI2007]